MSDNKADPPVKHIKVTVTKTTDPSNGAKKYSAKYKPEVIHVTDSDTILNFKLCDKTAGDIIITNVEMRPKDNDQLSTPSISKNRKQMTLSDINTVSTTMHLDFEYGSNDSSALMAARECDSSASDDYPEIINEPPP